MREGIDLAAPTGKMLAGIFASLAKFERALIMERAEAVRDSSRAAGKTVAPGPWTPRVWRNTRHFIKDPVSSRR